MQQVDTNVSAVIGQLRVGYRVLGLYIYLCGVASFHSKIHLMKACSHGIGHNPETWKLDMVATTKMLTECIEVGMHEAKHTGRAHAIFRRH